jgi:dynein intermediate chain 2
MFDRETKREKIIEAKQRELKLKTKSSAKADTAMAKLKYDKLVEAEARMIAEAEKEFDDLIATIVITVHLCTIRL